MATDSIMGLFQTPEQYQMAQRAQVEAQMAQEANMDPYQRANYLAGMSGYGLGKLASGVMGAQDPMLKLQSVRQSIMRNVDQTNPQSMMQAAQALAQAGDQQGAAQLAQMARTANTELIKNRQAESVIKKNEAWQQAQTDSAQKRNIIAEVEDKLAKGEAVDQVTINRAKLAFGDISRPKTFQQADGTIVTVPPTVDASMFPNIGKFMTGGGSSGSAGGGVQGRAGVITTPLSEEKAIQAEEARRGRLNGLEAGSAQLQTTLDTITQTKDLIGKKTTGWGSYLSAIPTSDAMTLADNTETIKASVALTKLKEMKQESKTGASGLGALNMKELETIQSILGKLNPKSANYATDLKKIEDFFVRAQTAMDEEVRLTKGGAATQQRPNSSDVAPKQSTMSGKNPQLQPSPEGEALIKRNMDGNPAYSRAQVITNLILAKKLPQGYK